MRVIRLSMMAGVLVIAAACGGGGPATTAGPGATGTPAAAACTGSGGTQVAIADFTFNPRQATVAVGGSVTWTNADTAPHTVTFDDGTDCGRLNQDGSVSQTFPTAGTFAYKCAIHPGSMRGSVVVQ